MNWIKTAVTVVGIAAAVEAWLVLPFGCASAENSIESDLFYVRHAQLKCHGLIDVLSSKAPADRDAVMGVGVRVHRIAPGIGTVIARREVARSTFGPDTDTYYKITLWLPDGLPDEATSIDFRQSPRNVLVVSVGGTAWPGAGCSMRPNAGTVHLVPTSAGIAVDLDGQFVSTPGRPFYGDCGFTRVRESS